MSNITLLAIDVAKNVFQLHGVNQQGNCVLKKRLSREKLPEFMAKLPACQVVMEACGGSHYWCRNFQSLGHTAKLIHPKFVTPFVKGNKTDSNDSEAIAEAAARPTMRYVTPKSIEQQDIQCILRIREQLMAERVALSNQTRGFLAEYGIVMPQGVASFRKRLPVILEDRSNELTDFLRTHLRRCYDRFCLIEKEIDIYTQEVKEICKTSELAQKIFEIEGVGPITAATVLSLGDLKQFRNGRHFSAFVGLVPRERSSGNKQVRLGMSKRGDRYLRSLLIHGARSVLLRAGKKQSPKTKWLMELMARRGMNRACGALANKTARHIWAVMTKGESYDARKTCQWTEPSLTA